MKLKLTKKNKNIVLIVIVIILLLIVLFYIFNMLKYKENFQTKKCYIKSMGDFNNKKSKKPSLSGCDLTYLKNNKTLLKTISKDIFKGIDLSNANLSGVDLSELNLTGTNLKGAKLTNANLTNANLYEANLTEANLTNANLTGANFINTNLTKVNLTKANLTNYAFINVNLTKANLTNTILTGLWIKDSNLTEANFSGAIFNGTCLMGVNLTKANLSKIKINTREIISNKYTIGSTELINKYYKGGITSENITESKDVKLPPNYKILNGYILGPMITLTGTPENPINLTKIDLTNMNLSKSYIENVDFTGTRLGGYNGRYGVNFEYSCIYHADFTKAVVLVYDNSMSFFDPNNYLNNVNLSYATLNSVKMDNSSLSMVASINNTTFLNSSCINLKISSININPISNVIFDNCILSNAKFSDSPFSNIGFVNGTKLNNTKFEGGATFININYNGIDLTGATFKGTPLMNVNFSSANLTGTTFYANQLTNVNFSNANLKGAKFTDVIFTDCLNNKNLSSLTGLFNDSNIKPDCINAPPPLAGFNCTVSGTTCSTSDVKCNSECKTNDTNCYYKSGENVAFNTNYGC